MRLRAVKDIHASGRGDEAETAREIADAIKEQPDIVDG